MAVSRSTGHSEQGEFWQRVFGRLSRYDLVLTAIPLVFLLVLVAHVLFSVSVLAALGAGAALSTAAVADALFVNPPVR